MYQDHIVNVNFEAPYSVVVWYQRFRGPCCLHRQSEVARMRKNGIDIGLDWRGTAGVASQ